jgi:hypothetical protein
MAHPFKLNWINILQMTIFSGKRFLEFHRATLLSAALLLKDGARSEGIDL